jgi:hypothetical protein
LETTPPPLPPAKKESSHGFTACLWGCGFLLVGLALAVALFFVVLNALPLIWKPDPNERNVPAEYVGVWETSDYEVGRIVIMPNGDASAEFRSSGSQFSINGGHATLNTLKKTLSVKFWFLGRSWKVDSPPHQNGSQMEMTLDGVKFHRTKTFGVNGGPQIEL